MSRLRLDKKQIIDKIQEYFSPPLPDIELEHVRIDGKHILVVTIPVTYAPMLLIKDLQIGEGCFDKLQNFIGCQKTKTYFKKGVTHQSRP